MRQVKDATNDIKREINDSAKSQGVDTDLAKDIKKEISDVKEGLDKITGPIKRNMWYFLMSFWNYLPKNLLFYFKLDSCLCSNDKFNQ